MVVSGSAYLIRIPGWAAESGPLTQLNAYEGIRCNARLAERRGRRADWHTWRGPIFGPKEIPDGPVLQATANTSKKIPATRESFYMRKGKSR